MGQDGHCCLRAREHIRRCLGRRFSDFQRDTHSVCAMSCTQVLQSRVLHCCVFTAVCPGQAPPGLLLPKTPIVQQPSCSQRKEVRQLLVQGLCEEQNLLADIPRAHPAAVTHRGGFGEWLCSSGTAANTTVGGYLQPGSPSKVMMISLATRLLLQAALILGHLPERCSSSREGSSSKALCNPTFPGWALQPDKEKLNFCSLTSGSDSFPRTELIADQWFLSADINTNITAGQLVIEAVYYSSIPQ